MIEEHAVAQPAWIDALVEVVRCSLRPLGFIGHLGYRIWEPESPHNPCDGWMLAVFPTAHEWAGGSRDGSLAVSGFALDVGEVLKAFAEVHKIAWNCPAHYNGELDGPELVVEGSVLGKRVLLRVFHLPPSDEPICYVVDPALGEAWQRRSEDCPWR